jgi:NAD+ synthetase
VVKIALAQINTTVGDLDGNLGKMHRAVRAAEGEGADLVVFSEMTITGYPPRDLVERVSFVNENLQKLEEVAAWTGSVGIICGFVDCDDTRGQRKLFNAGALLDGGKIRFRQYKSLLPTYDVFDEMRYFEPARERDIVEFRGRRIGLSICEDLWNDKDFWKHQRYGSDPVEELVGRGAEILVNISGSPYSMGKLMLRQKMVGEIAGKYGCPLVYVNQVGGNDELLFDGASFAMNGQGRVASQCKDFEEDTVLFDTERENGPIHSVSEEEEESLLKALVMGTRDYVEKCGFSKVVVGLSGGIDSSVTAVVAGEAVGKDNVMGVMMPSPYSSEESLRDARKLADRLGITYRVIPIHEIFLAYLNALRETFEGQDTDVTEENIQARIRGSILMAISNKFGYLVLTTGNKSETAVGYSTLYGDMAGGLGVISDVPKMLVYRLARHMNRHEELIPEHVLEKAPSAELRPNQRDEDSLPPYPVLDGILKAYVEENRGPDEVISLGYDAEVVREIVRRIDASEFKRRQAVPGLRVTSRAFGMGRRLPIAQRYRAG